MKLFLPVRCFRKWFEGFRINCCGANSWELNLGRYKSITFLRLHHSVDFSYLLRGILGVVVDSRMSFSKHIDVTFGKALVMLGFVSKRNKITATITVYLLILKKTVIFSICLVYLHKNSLTLFENSVVFQNRELYRNKMYFSLVDFTGNIICDAMHLHRANKFLFSKWIKPFKLSKGEKISLKNIII
jgi:hypothetical protein